MFFNNCNWCRRPCCGKEERCPKQEKNYCDIKDKYDYEKYDNCEDKNDKCDYGKQEKCCCHIRCDRKCNCGKEDNKHCDRHDDCSCKKNGRHFDNQNRFEEYNDLGNFYQKNNQNYIDGEKSSKYNDENNYGRRERYCNKEDRDNNYYQDDAFNYDKSYTPNWESDRDCKCEKDKCSNPIKFVCFPWYRY